MSIPRPARSAWVLWCLGVLGSAAALPYLDALLTAVEAHVPPKSPRPAPWLLALLSVGQSALLLAAAVAAGRWFARHVGLGAPLLEGWLDREGTGESAVRRPAMPVLAGAAMVGVVAGAVVLGLEFAAFRAHLPPALADAEAAPWRGLLAALYGGTVEELLVRLFLLSALAWTLLRLRRGSAAGRATRPGAHAPFVPGGQVPSAVFWVANVTAALAFGLLHLPTTALLAPLTPVVVARALVLNGVAGATFGVLYWRAGLEAAMVAHVAADVVLHGVGPLLPAH